MNTTTHSNKFIKVFRINNDKLQYLSTITVIDCEFNVDILAQQNSTLEILNQGLVEKGNLAIYYDKYFVIPFIIDLIEKKENLNLELSCRVYIDMFDLPFPSQNAGLLNYKEKNEKIVSILTKLNSNVNTYKNYFPKINNHYKFEGSNWSILQYFGVDRFVLERDILETILKLEIPKLEISLKSNDLNSEKPADNYYLSVELTNRIDMEEDPNADIPSWIITTNDNNLVMDYQLIYSNIEYNCLIMGILQSGYKLFYMNKDGSILYEHDPMFNFPNGWLNDAALPLKVKRIWIDQFNDDVSAYESALYDLTGQYMNHEISLTIDLESPKNQATSLSDIIYKKIKLIDLNADVTERNTFVTGIKYTGNRNLELILGYSRTGFIKKITKKLKGK